MNNILAAQVLRSHLPEITDGAYKTATEIAIETLYMDAINDWHRSDTELSAHEYLGLTEEEYDYWILGIRDFKGAREKNNPIDDAIDEDIKEEIKQSVDYWKHSHSNRLKRSKELEKLNKNK
jgi:hypothetical protein